MKHLWIFCLILPLTACSNAVTSNPPANNPPNKPAWALGDTLHVTGTLMGWAEGHRGPPVEGNLFGEMYPPDYDPTEDEGELIALGTVRPDASFEFGGMCRGSGTDMGCITVPVTDALCEEVTASDARSAIAIIDAIFVPGIPFSEPPPPRPSGWVWISTEKPANTLHRFTIRTHTYAYADRDTHVRGTCFGVLDIDFDLRKGWNSLELDPSGGSYKTAAVPPNARWWFVNPHTSSP